jgi:hypothetical protein
MKKEQKQEALQGGFEFLLRKKVYKYDPTSRKLVKVRDMAQNNQDGYNLGAETKYFEELKNKMRPFRNKLYNKTRNLGAKGMKTMKYSVMNPLSATGYAAKSTVNVAAVVGEHTVLGTTRAVGRGLAKMTGTPYQSLIDAMDDLYQQAKNVTKLGEDYMTKNTIDLNWVPRNVNSPNGVVKKTMRQLLIMLDEQVNESHIAEETLKKEYRVVYRKNRSNTLNLKSTYTEGIHTKNLIILILMMIREELNTKMNDILETPNKLPDLDKFNNINRAKKALDKIYKNLKIVPVIHDVNGKVTGPVRSVTPAAPAAQGPEAGPGAPAATGPEAGPEAGPAATAAPAQGTGGSIEDVNYLTNTDLYDAILVAKAALAAAPEAAARVTTPQAE